MISYGVFQHRSISTFISHNGFIAQHVAHMGLEVREPRLAVQLDQFRLDHIRYPRQPTADECALVAMNHSSRFCTLR